jgi:hypothetical protein
LFYSPTMTQEASTIEQPQYMCAKCDCNTHVGMIGMFCQQHPICHHNGCRQSVMHAGGRCLDHLFVYEEQKTWTCVNPNTNPKDTTPASVNKITPKDKERLNDERYQYEATEYYNDQAEIAAIVAEEGKVILALRSTGHVGPLCYSCNIHEGRRVCHACGGLYNPRENHGDYLCRCRCDLDFPTRVVDKALEEGDESDESEPEHERHRVRGKCGCCHDEISDDDCS